jgi:predicted XRE-type DNA-binding protein
LIPPIFGQNFSDNQPLETLEGDAVMTEKLDMVLGSGNPFQGLGLPEADTKLIKADLAAEIIGVLRERELTGAAAKLAGVPAADISRIRKADLSRFTIDRLVAILNRLHRRVQVTVTTQAGGYAERPAP